MLNFLWDRKSLHLLQIVTLLFFFSGGKEIGIIFESIEFGWLAGPTNNCVTSLSKKLLPSCRVWFVQLEDEGSCIVLLAPAI